MDGRVRRPRRRVGAARGARARRTTGSRWIAKASTGFVYCVATYGVTGERDELAGTARQLIERLRPLTDLPLLVGVGIGTPAQAAEVGTFADGVVVGTALDGEAARRATARGCWGWSRRSARPSRSRDARDGWDDNIPQGRRFRIGV